MYAESLIFFFCSWCDFGWLVWLFFLRIFKHPETHDKRSDLAVLKCLQEVCWDLDLLSTARCVCLSVAEMPACMVPSHGAHACLAGIGTWAACRKNIDDIRWRCEQSPSNLLCATLQLGHSEPAGLEMDPNSSNYIKIIKKPNNPTQKKKQKQKARKVPAQKCNQNSPTKQCSELLVACFRQCWV